LPQSQTKLDVSTDENVNMNGRLSDLILPLIVLFVATFFFIFWTGYITLDGKTLNLIDIFGEADVSSSLFYSGIIALLTTFILFFRHVKLGHLTSRHFIQAVTDGIKSMMPAVLILIFAWTISDLID